MALKLKATNGQDPFLWVPKHPIYDHDAGRVVRYACGKVYPGEEFIWRGDPKRIPRQSEIVGEVGGDPAPSPARTPTHDPHQHEAIGTPGVRIDSIGELQQRRRAAEEGAQKEAPYGQQADEDAPYGRRKDGTPKKAPGRKPRAEAGA